MWFFSKDLPNDLFATTYDMKARNIVFLLQSVGSLGKCQFDEKKGRFFAKSPFNQTPKQPQCLILMSVLLSLAFKRQNSTLYLKAE